jgi:hypothetical protein
MAFESICDNFIAEYTFGDFDCSELQDLSPEMIFGPVRYENGPLWIAPRGQ